MRHSPSNRFRPFLERLEEKQVLSASSTSLYVLNTTPAKITSASHSAAASSTASDGFLGYRITNPSVFSNELIPPFQQVLVQNRQPVPGQVYNILFISVRNGSAQTFNASNNFQVRLPNGPAVPILTGSQQWYPRQVLVFYVLTKKYYPLNSQIAGGFQLDLGGRSSTLVPGPSGIFLRIKYNPATFARALNEIVAYGQGAQGGLGNKYGLPNTSINEFVNAKTRRIDFGGHF